MSKVSTEIILLLVFVTIVILIMLGLILLIIFMYKKNQESHFKQIEALKTDYERNILNTQLEIKQTTFQQISREIHDNINLSLTLAKLYLNTARVEDPKKTEILIEQSERLITEAIDGLRNISSGIEEDNINSKGLINAIEEEIEKINKLGVYNVQFNITGHPIFLDTERERVIFRIIQESFNNIIKHSKAHNIGISLIYKKEHIELIIQDDGIGFRYPQIKNTKQKNGSQSGLENINIRSKMFNGKSIIKSKPGKGTKIFVTIPYDLKNLN